MESSQTPHLSAEEIQKVKEHNYITNQTNFYLEKGYTLKQALLRAYDDLEIVEKDL